MTPTFEDELRAMLTERARDVDTVPARVTAAAVGDGDGDVIDLGSRRTGRPSRRRWLTMAAAACVVGVAIGVAALRHDDRPAIRPDHPNPNPTVDTRSVQECRTELPLVWARMFRTPVGGDTGVTPSLQDQPLAIRGDGSVLVSRDLGDSRSVDVVGPTGLSTRLLSLSDATERRADFAAFAGGKAVLGLVRSPRGANGAGTPLMEIRIVELDTGRTVHTIATMLEGDFIMGRRTSTTVGLVGDTIVWDSRPRYDAKAGTLQSYDLSTGRTRTAYRGPVVQPHFSAGGVSWTGTKPGTERVRIPAPGVPAAVRTATDPVSRATLATDGRHWAWRRSNDGQLAWYDGRSIIVLSGRTQPTDDVTSPIVVAGRYLFFANGSGTMLADIRTGAVGALGSAEVRVTGAAGSRVVAALSAAKGDGKVSRTDTARLPVPRC